VGRKAADRLSSCGGSAAKVLPPLLRANYSKAITKKKLPKQLAADNCRIQLGKQAKINWLNESGENPWAIPIKLLMGQFIEQLVRAGPLINWLIGQIAELIGQQSGRQT
jgi:hypothetical protein